MTTARSARTAKGLVLVVIAAVVLWECRMLLTAQGSGGHDDSELRACKQRIAELERQLSRATSVAGASVGAADGAHGGVASIRRRTVVQESGAVVDTILVRVRLRGGAPEVVDANFTLFGDLERLDAPSSTDGAQLLPKTRVFVVIVSSQSERAAKQRRLIRATWLAQIKDELDPADIVARFFVGVVSDGRDRGGARRDSTAVRAEVMAEMQQHGDMVVVGVGDAYGGLIAKVQASLQWVVSAFHADIVAKFDDDCYVSPDALVHELSRLPRKRLYWGRMMGGGPIQRDGGRNAEPNMPRGVDWFPPYASGGGGYALSWDLVHAVAFPLVKQLDMVNEDGHLGVLLLPYDVHRETTQHVHPYGIQREGGKCTAAADVVAVHYVKDAGEHDCEWFSSLPAR
jgi:hypothetical protein